MQRFAFFFRLNFVGGRLSCYGWLLGFRLRGLTDRRRRRNFDLGLFVPTASRNEDRNCYHKNPQ